MLWFMTLFLQPPSINAPSVMLGFALAVAPVGCDLHDGGQRLGALGEGHRLQQRLLLRRAQRADHRQRGDQALVAGLLDGLPVALDGVGLERSEEHTSELQSLLRISYAVFCCKK